MPQSNEQWLSGGDCNKCRKRKYCHTSCKANRHKQQIDAVAIGMKLLMAYRKTVKRKLND